MAEKFIDWTTYNYVQCNPLIWVDPNGTENIIYLIGVQGSKKKELEGVAKAANQIFKDLGLETRVEIYKGASSDFDVSKLDATDGVAVMGYKSSVSEFVKNKLSSISSDSFRKTLASEENQKDDSKPEISENPGRLITLDAGKAAKSFATNTRSSKAYAIGYALAHGAGHNAGVNHPIGGIMTDGRTTVDRILINTSKYEDLVKVYNEEYIKNVRKYYPEYTSLQRFVCPSNDLENSEYRNNMIKKFGDEKAKVNYK
jgi:hypothetical protein